jgi:hypothetical protein
MSDPTKQESRASSFPALPRCIGYRGAVIVRNAATVVCQSPVDGTPRRRSRGARKSRVTLSKHVVVDPRVMAVVRQVLRDSQRVEILSETEVLLVNKPT